MAAIEPTPKSPEMTEFLEKTFGRSSAIAALQCVPTPIGCGREIPPSEIECWSMVEHQEYRISGLCKKCQDEVFRDPDAEDECTCATPCCEADVGIGIIDCGSQHCRVHGPLATQQGEESTEPPF